MIDQVAPWRSSRACVPDTVPSSLITARTGARAHGVLVLDEHHVGAPAAWRLYVSSTAIAVPCSDATGCLEVPARCVAPMTGAARCRRGDTAVSRRHENFTLTAMGT